MVRPKWPAGELLAYGYPQNRLRPPTIPHLSKGPFLATEERGKLRIQGSL